MAESKKKPAISSKFETAPEPQTSLGQLLSREELENLSTLQLLDLVVSKLPPRHNALLDVVYLRDRIVALEELNDQARQAIEKLDAIVEKLRSPAFRVGTLLMPIEPDTAHGCIGRTDYVCRVDRQIPLASLHRGD